MGSRWRFNRFRFHMVMLLVMCLLNNIWRLGLSLNAEGLALLRFREGVVTDPFGALLNWNDDDGLNDPCSWFGVECSDGKVVILNLKDLCLEGTLAPEIGNLIHIKSIILRNNSFYGVIPKEIEELKELEVLDLGFNNFSGPLPIDIGGSLSLTILLLDNNDFLEDISPEIHELNMLSELQVDKSQLIDAVHRTTCQRRVLAWNITKSGNVAERRLLQEDAFSLFNVLKKGTKPPNSSSRKLSPQASTHSPPPKVHPAAPSPFQSHAPSKSSKASTAHPPTTSIQGLAHPSTTSIQGHAHHTKGILAVSIGAPIFILIVAVGVLLCRNTKVASVKPWATGLSGQLQKAFVTGVPSLRRAELETACEDFSNIIDSLSSGTTYKGTLSSGVEIAVVSTVVTSTKDWSKNFEAQFRKKIDTLSRVNHKNFVNLLGYCEEEEPFTRMMIFEYAPNGTLFEHLHIKEAEHLDWGARLRIGMGMAYCLDYMHHLNPPVAHKDLNSKVIYLTEDYAAKISDFEFWHVVGVSKESDATDFQDTPSVDVESNIYSFGEILLEMITGRLPYSVENGTLVEWASVYLRGEQPCTDMVDPMLKSFQEDELEKLCAVIASCIHPDPKQRPTMREVATQLRAITALGPDGAIPKLTPLWWAELEILSTEAC